MFYLRSCYSYTCYCLKKNKKHKKNIKLASFIFYKRDIYINNYYIILQMRNVQL